MTWQAMGGPGRKHDTLMELQLNKVILVLSIIFLLAVFCKTLNISYPAYFISGSFPT